jgi:serine/threonine protein kinase/WD40 repeat protein
MAMKSKPLDPTRTSLPTESQDRRVLAAMESYLNELEAGKVPERHQFLARYPEIAGELIGPLEAIDFLHGIAPQTIGDKTTPMIAGDPPVLPTRASLGDFRLIRQIGQGGMGVVYEAEQLSLGRRVAVKVLPFAAMLNDQHRKRFYNEARAAATLDHPHIVPVYFVGQERGVHFFAMQLINGQSLADLIATLSSSRTGDPIAAGSRTKQSRKPLHPPPGGSDAVAAGEGAKSKPSSLGKRNPADTQVNFLSTISTVHSGDRSAFFRTAARLGAEAAEAIEHAHQLGILHRDIKPGNLLVDGLGKLWVADFGLATIETGETLTRTGGVVGTAAYMSPEQAAATPNIDGRSDVYALGATLYELLTLRRHRGDPANGGATNPKSHAVVDSLRSLESTIPVDLETIVLKSLAVDPADRYQTAGAMAADLRSFLAGTEIKARRLSFAQRQTRRLRRHQRFVVPVAAASFLAVLLIAVAATAYSNRLANALQEKEQALAAAENSRKRAELSESTAQQSARAARDSEMFARRLSYRSDMQLAFDKYAGGDLPQAAEILARQIPAESEVDIRGVEWQLLNAEVNAKYTTLGAHDGPTTECVLYPDGNTVATAGEDGLVHVWDIAGRRRVKTIEPRIGEIHAMAISPDGTTLAVGGKPTIMTLAFALIHLIDTETGKHKGTCQRHITTIESIEFSPDGKLIAAGSRNEHVKISTVTGEHLHTIDNSHRNHSISFSPDSKHIATCASEETLQIWDCETGQPRFEQPINVGNPIRMVKWSPTGEFLAATWQHYPVLYIYDVNTGNLLAEASRDRDHPQRFSALFLSRDNRICIGDSLGTVRQWDAKIDFWRKNLATKSSKYNQSQEFGSVYASKEDVTSIVRLPSESFVTTHLDGSVVLTIHQATAARIQPIEFSTVAAACVSESEVFLAGTDGMVRRLDLESGKVLQQIPTQTALSISDIAVSEEPTMLVVGYHGGQVDLMDVSREEAESLWSPEPVDLKLPPHRVATKSVQVAISKTGDFVARSGLPEQFLMVWHSGQRLPFFQNRYLGFGSAIKFSPDSTTLACCHDSVELHELRTGDLIHQHRTYRIESLQFSADGKTLAMGLEDGQLQLIDLESKTKRFAGNEADDRRSVAFDRIGRTIVSTGRTDHALRFTDVETVTDYGSIAHPTPDEDVSTKYPRWLKDLFVFERRIVKWNAAEALENNGSMLAIWDW